jgi:hypothetical protein
MNIKRIAQIVVVLFVFCIMGYGIFFRQQTSKKVISILNDKIEISSPEVEVKKENSVVNAETNAESQKTLEENNTASVVNDMPKSISEKISSNESKQIVNDSTQSGKIISNLVSWGFAKSSGRKIKAIIVHTSYNALGGDVFDFDKVLKEWKDAGVAPHYAIDRHGNIYQLVMDNNIAWHAGNSKLPDGTTDVNGISLGIEVISTQDAKFTSEQYIALNDLIAQLKKKYDISYVLGHDDIAPGRKTDPWGIDWKKVAK